MLCFAGHTDVVPTGPREEWHTDPFEPVSRTACCTARGAADMKSGLAAMVTATERFVAAHPRSRRLAGVSADERRRRTVGRRHAPVMEVLRSARREDRLVRRRRAHQLDDALGDMIKIGRRGSLSGQAHRARRAGSRRLSASRRQPGARGRAGAGRTRRHAPGTKATSIFQPTTFQVSNISAGTGAPNVIPGRAEGALQPPLLDRADGREAAADGHSRSSTATK